MFLKPSLFIDNKRALKASFNFVQAQRPYLSRQNMLLLTVLWSYLVN